MFGSTRRATDKFFPRRRVPWLLVLVAALCLAVALWPSSAAVGSWHSAHDRSEYEEFYRQVLEQWDVEPTRSEYVSTDFGTVHALVWEAGDTTQPPVVLMPGRSSGAPMWAENLPDWVGKRTVIALDPIGDAGLSAQSAPLTSMDDQADWIAQALEEMDVGPVHSVGHSFGGATAAAHALRYPEQIASLSLAEPVLVLEQMPVSTYFWSMVSTLPMPQSIRDEALGRIGGATGEEVEGGGPMAKMIDAASQSYSAALPMPEVLTDDELRALPAATRIDIGGAQSLAGGQKAADRAASVLPEATTTVWPEGTHSLPMQMRPEYSSELMEFWAASDPS